MAAGFKPQRHREAASAAVAIQGFKWHPWIASLRSQ
jgi:hypothetical protein